jgi:ribosomal RNA-processing protein 17
MAKKQNSKRKGKHPNKNKSKGGGGGSADISSSFKRPRHEKLEIKFNPEARRQYLTGLSAKKKERRAFGLAMQKVKDRKAKLEEKRENRKALLEQIEEAEQFKEQTQKLNAANAHAHNDNGDDYTSSSHTTRIQKPLNQEIKENKVTTYQDQTTQSQFGGQVIVTTTYNFSSGDESDDDEEDDIANEGPKKITKHIDTEQRYAGSVQKYIAQIKGHLPNKKNKTMDAGKSLCKRGKHGAQTMKGMGNSKDFKMAKKTLDRATDRKAQGPGNKKGQKRKSRR